MSARLGRQPPIAARLRPIQTAVEGSVELAYQLCRRMTLLENHRLVLRSNVDLEDNLAEIEAKLEAATDPVVEREYKESRQALQTRIDSLERLERLLDRTEAHLSSLAGELDRVLTEVVRIQAHGPDRVAREVEEITRALDDQAKQLREFQDEVGTT